MRLLPAMPAVIGRNMIRSVLLPCPGQGFSQGRVLVFRRLQGAAQAGQLDRHLVRLEIGAVGLPLRVTHRWVHRFFSGSWITFGFMPISTRFSFQAASVGAAMKPRAKNILICRSRAPRHRCGFRPVRLWMALLPPVE